MSHMATQIRVLILCQKGARRRFTRIIVCVNKSVISKATTAHPGGAFCKHSVLLSGCLQQLSSHQWDTNGYSYFESLPRSPPSPLTAPIHDNPIISCPTYFASWTAPNL